MSLIHVMKTECLCFSLAIDLTFICFSGEPASATRVGGNHTFIGRLGTATAQRPSCNGGHGAV